MDLRSTIGSTRNGRFSVRSNRPDRATRCSVGFSQTHDIVVAVLFHPTGGNVPFDHRTRQARLTGWARVDLVHRVCLVHLVSLVQPNRLNKQERPADPRASRARVCGAGGLSQHSAHTRSPTSNSAGSITSEPGQEHRVRTPAQPSALPMLTSGSLLSTARKIGQNVRTAFHLGGGGIGGRYIEKIFNFEEQRQFIQRVKSQIF